MDRLRTEVSLEKSKRPADGPRPFVDLHLLAMCHFVRYNLWTCGWPETSDYHPVT